MASIERDTAGRIVPYGIRTVRLLILPLLIVLALATGSQAQTQAQSEDVTLTKAQLEQLVAPIALYPDSLLTQVLMASTYPLEVVQAARWAKNNSKLTGKELEDALQKQPWDPAIKSIVVAPDVLKMMNEKIDWTEALGNAFLAQQDELMDAVQDLRARADASGSLKTTPQQKVSKQTTSTGKTAVVIEPADPEAIYVPAYDPELVYGEWPYPDYPPYAWYPLGYYGGAGWWWGGRILAGAGIWAGWNWANNHLTVNPLRYNNFNRTNINNPTWNHRVEHRKGVPYASPRVANKFGQQGQAARREAAKQNLSQRTGAGTKQAKGKGPSAGTKQAKGKGPSAGTKQAKGKGPSAGTKQAKGKGTAQAKRTASKGTKAAGRAKTAQRAGAGRTVGRGGGGRSMGGGVSRGGGGRGGGGGGRGGGGRGRSDIALKHDIVLLGRLDNGLGFYRFSYNGSDKSYVGVLAQEVQAVMPDAVVRGSDGYLQVFYDRIGVKFQSYERWLAAGAKVPTAH